MNATMPAIRQEFARFWQASKLESSYPNDPELSSILGGGAQLATGSGDKVDIGACQLSNGGRFVSVDVADGRELQLKICYSDYPSSNEERVLSREVYWRPEGGAPLTSVDVSTFEQGTGVEVSGQHSAPLTPQADSILGELAELGFQIAR